MLAARSPDAKPRAEPRRGTRRRAIADTPPGAAILLGLGSDACWKMLQR
jgi:hypothetical protein